MFKAYFEERGGILKIGKQIFEHEYEYGAFTISPASRDRESKLIIIPYYPQFGSDLQGREGGAFRDTHTPSNFISYHIKEVPSSRFVYC